MNHLSLFSGIGGLDLAAEWAGFRTVAFVERDPYCQRVLARHWPGVPCFDDVRAVTADSLNAGPSRPGRRDEHGEPQRESRDGHAEVRVGIVSGGFPCQPHSVAGKRQASADDRDLWPEFARVIREIRPRWVVAENVPGLLHSESGRFFGAVLGDLADLGYSAGWGVWGAADVGALHRRERVFIVAHAPDERHEWAGAARGRRDGSQDGGNDVAYAERQRGRGRHAEREDAEDAGQPPRYSLNWKRLAQPGLGVLADGIPGWMGEPDIPRVAVGVKDRVHKLRALGNAVHPGQAYPLFRAIAEIEGMT